MNSKIGWKKSLKLWVTTTGDTMKYSELKQTEKDELVELSSKGKCFLNGEPAKIYGRQLDFPIVAQFDGPLEAEFSWTTAQRIMNRDGKFVL